MTERLLPLPAALRLAAALSLARSEHVTRLVDAATRPDGTVRLELEEGELPLAQLLARGLSPGEAVTILAPLAGCVESLVAAGIVHGGIRVAAIALDARGAPVLGAFDGASVGHRQPARGAADRAAYRELALTVLGAVRGGGDGGGADALERLRGAIEAIEPDRPGSLLACAERLLALVRPEPVRLGRAREPASPPAPPPGESGRRGAAASDGVIRTRRAIEAIRSRLGAIRPRFWVPAALVATALLAVMLVIPGDAPSAPGPARTGTAPDGSGAPAAGMPTAPSPPPSPEPSASSADGAVAREDPAEAARVLRPDATRATVLDDYGDVVLVAIETASGAEDVLVERTDAGWRLRDTLPEERG